MSNFTSGCWVLNTMQVGKWGWGGGGSYVKFPTSLGGIFWNHTSLLYYRLLTGRSIEICGKGIHEAVMFSRFCFSVRIL